MAKKILILGGGNYYVKTIKSVSQLGYEVHCIDRDAGAPGFQYADYHAVIDIGDREGVLEYARQKNIKGIMPVNDFGTRAGFFASQKLNLIGPSLLSGICGNDKGIMREVWGVEELPQPQYHVFDKDASVESISQKISFPLVVKPTDCGGGGRGIMIANNSEELRQAISHAQPFAKNNRLIAEQFIDGVELTIDSIVYQGQVIPLAISDKIKADSRFRVATSLNFPADLDEDMLKMVKKLAVRATEVMGIQSGMTHLELIITPGRELKLVEIGMRGGGGHLFNTIIEVVTGVNAPQELAKILCGDVPNLTIQSNQGCVYRFFNPPGQGIIKNVRYDRELVAQSSVVDFGITIKPGGQHIGLVDSLRRVGYVITKGRDRQEAVQLADLIESSVYFDFE